MNIKTQTFLVVGISKSGYAVATHILLNNGKCYIYEQLKNEQIDKSIERLTNLGAIRVGKEQIVEIIENIDVVVLSPGVPLNHEIAVSATKLGKRVLGELEYGYLRFTPTIVAVTGTNGKTTTVTMLDEILKKSGMNSQLVGNIGTPLTEKLGEVDNNCVIVAEVSSFQLEGVNAFCPHISCITNIAPDHLERHYTMDNYIFLKKRIFKNQRESEYCVLNYDDDIVKTFSCQTKAKTVWVSLKEKVAGAYRKDDKLYFYDRVILEEKDLALKGNHNIYDALFAIACACLMGVEDFVIAQVLQEFKGVKHRIEYMCEKNGVIYYNDSKATNTNSTICAIDSMTKPTVLIMGGSEKGEKYDALFEKIKASNVKHVILTGASRYNMLNAASKCGYANITVTADFNHAVKIASIIAKDGQTVLLSPACASFDNFNSYQERGEAFRNIVEGI